MFALERIRVIKKFLEERQQVEVHALSELLDVSEVTVRRDLEKMEKDGLLIRTHGGAVIAEPSREIRSDYTTDDAESEKGAVSVELILETASTAARLVSDGDTVMLFSGPLCRALALRLNTKSALTILTNDIEIARSFKKYGSNRLVLLGGDLNPDEMALFGTLTVDDLQRFHVDRLFAEVDGFGEGFELSVHTQEKAMLIREGRSRAQSLVILCSAAGFEKNAFYSFGTAKTGDMIVTDRTVSAAVKQRFFDANVCLYTAVDIFEGAV